MIEHEGSFGIGQKANPELQFALALRLLAKAIHRLGKVHPAEAQRLLVEAKNFGFDIQIMPDPTVENQ